MYDAILAYEVFFFTIIIFL